MCCRIRCYGSRRVRGHSLLQRCPTRTNPTCSALRDHMERLHRSCKIAQIELPYSVDELMDATLEVIRANRLPACYIRPLVYRGYGVMGVADRGARGRRHRRVAWDAYLGADALEKTAWPWASPRGASARTTPFRRR